MLGMENVKFRKMHSEHYINIAQKYYTIQPDTEKNGKGCVCIDNITWTKLLNALKNSKAPRTDIINLELLNKHNIGPWYFTYKTI